MAKFYTFLICLLFIRPIAFTQTSGDRMLFVIDSIPILRTPESWNSIPKENIAGQAVIRSKDSLKQLGWNDLDGITYLFTKEYRRWPTV